MRPRRTHTVLPALIFTLTGGFFPGASSGAAESAPPLESREALAVDAEQLPADARSMIKWATLGADFRESEVKFTHAELRLIAGYVQCHPDLSSYLLLGKLLEDAPDEYDRLPVETRIKVWCASMAGTKDMNDFGHLNVNGKQPTTQASERDVPIAQLVKIGRPALPFLIPLLDNKERVFFSGSEDSSAALVITAAAILRARHARSSSGGDT